MTSSARVPLRNLGPCDRRVLVQLRGKAVDHHALVSSGSGVEAMA